MKNNGLYTPKEVADILGVTLDAMRKWIQAGKVNVVYLPMSNRQYITTAELNRLQTPINEKP